MNESKKSTKKIVTPKQCPICGVTTTFVNRVTEDRHGTTADWYECQCGVAFQSELPSHNCYNKVYIDRYALAKEADLRSIHAARTYAPIIEELTYGRMLLDVGFNTTHNMDFFERRGWLVWGIEVNKDIKGHKNIYKGNFETYDFSPNIDKEKLKELTGKESIKRTFDLIWMSHVLEHFSDPIRALRKAYNLLSETGVIYIATPDIDFIYKTGIAGFPHWKKNEHYIMWSERALVRELERIGFNIIMKRRNFSSRFPSWYDVHVIAQKRFF